MVFLAFVFFWWNSQCLGCRTDFFAFCLNPSSFTLSLRKLIKQGFKMSFFSKLKGTEWSRSVKSNRSVKLVPSLVQVYEAGHHHPAVHQAVAASRCTKQQTVLWRESELCLAPWLRQAHKSRGSSHWGRTQEAGNRCWQQCPGSGSQITSVASQNN